jgi:hypothetical protein
MDSSLSHGAARDARPKARRIAELNCDAKKVRQIAEQVAAGHQEKRGGRRAYHQLPFSQHSGREPVAAPASRC